MGHHYCPHCGIDWQTRPRDALVDGSASAFWQHAKDMHPEVYEQIKGSPIEWIEEDE